ncbi:MAG: YceI family protein [Balneolaceae bacterium]
MKSLSTILLLVILSFSTIAANNYEKRSEAWAVDKAHSSISFTVTHFFTPVDGTFDDYEAEILFDPADLDNSSLDVKIAVAGINTKNERRDGHLNSEDFFNSEQWPEIHFTSHTIEQTGENQFVARGELTIRDVTREFDLPFELLGVMDHPMRENSKVAGIVAATELNRTDFGVGVGDWAATAVVGNKVNIRINLELNSSS